jgi:hypothetical protein
MRKGLVTGSVLAFVLLAAYLGAGAPAELSTAAPRFTPAPATDMNAFEPAVERVALTSRDRARRAIGEPGQWDAVPVVAGEATALLEQLVMAERAVRDPAVTGKELAYMGHLQQLVYFQLIQRADLRDTVFSGIPQDLRRAADLNIAAGANLWLWDSTHVTELPQWRIVPASPIYDLLTYYKAAEAEFGVPWYYLAAINLVETRMGRIRGDSYAGAQGPMQFMPKTWDAYGDGDINDARDAILAAGRYLHATGAPEHMERAIWMYNHDNEYVDAVMKYGEVMRDDPSAFRGFYGWQVYFVTAYGTVFLPEGWSKD